MGLMKALVSSTKSTLADQWLEYYYCDTLSNDVLVKKATKVVNGGSNTKGSENIISNGSGFAVNEGQALLIVEDGRVIDFTVEPGRFTWNNSTEPSCFSGGFDGLVDSFKTLANRFKAGGTEAKDQRVYYINMKEIFDNKFGTASPMPYKDPTYRGIYIRYYGQYTFKIKDPLLFYSNVSGNVTSVYTKKELMSMCHAEFVTALDTAIAKCSDEGYQFNDLPKKQFEIANFMNDVLDVSWRERRGMEIEVVAIEKVTPDDESRDRIEKIDDAIMMSDSRVAAGRLVEAQAQALEKAAMNDAGAMQGFLGMGFAAQAGGMNTSNVLGGMQPQEGNPLFATPKKESAPEVKEVVEEKPVWVCECGNENTGKFCSECGTAKPQGPWTCECGHVNNGKFCSECGKKRP